MPPCRYKFLKCERIRREHGTARKMHDKYVAKLQKLLGLENCKPAKTPMVESSVVDETPALTGNDASLYRQCSGILNFIQKFRPESQYCIKEICRCLSNPTEYYMSVLKRLVRFLLGRKRLVFRYPWQRGGDARVLQ